MEFVRPIRDERKIEAIKRVLKSNNLRDYCLFTLGINSGLRISDLLNLSVANIMDVSGKPKDRITLKEHKTGKSKDFPMGCTTVKALKEYLDTRKDISLDHLVESPVRRCIYAAKEKYCFIFT